MIYSKTTSISLTNWHSFAKRIASPADPAENSPAAVERLMKELLPYITDIKNVHPQFHSKNAVKLIDFQNQAAKTYYFTAEERFLEESAKLQQLKGKGKPIGMMQLVIFNKYREAAEFIKAEPQVDAAYDSVKNFGQAAIIVCNFKKSIAKGVQLLKQKYGVPRSEISLIWGGSAQFALKKEERLSSSDIQSLLSLLALGKQPDPSIMKRFIWQMKNDDSGFDDSLAELDLGTQSRKERQHEIDKFQEGRSKYCFYTFKSGGIGLSLHHTDERTRQKVRHKESGYAFEEDIPLIPTRQRICYISPTYSAIEMVQGLGRAPRLTSLSDTIQLILFYKGTIEERVATIVSIKLKCLKKVVRQRQRWEDAIFERDTAYSSDTRTNDAIKLLQETTGQDDEDEEESPSDIYLEDDEEQ